MKQTPHEQALETSRKALYDNIMNALELKSTAGLPDALPNAIAAYLSALLAHPEVRERVAEAIHHSILTTRISNGLHEHAPEAIAALTTLKEMAV